MSDSRRNTLLQRASRRFSGFSLANPLYTDEASKPIVVAGFFRTASGIGQSARACAAGLEKHGLAPVCVDLSAAFGQIDFAPDIVLSPMPRAKRGTLILHVNAPETEAALVELGLFRGRAWRMIGCWHWELAEAPAAWIPASRRLSELWTASNFVARAFRGRISVPVKVVPPYAPLGAPPAAREGPPTCLVMADGRSSFERKNILGALKAFQLAAAGRADRRLVVKTRNLSEFSAFEAKLRAAIGKDARITVIDEAFSAPQLTALLSRAAIVMSLHRSEGFGLVLAEAMALGRPVVATAWSGNLDFMDEESAALVPYTLVPVCDPGHVYTKVGEARWAEPDIEAAAAWLEKLFDDAALCERLGMNARARIRDKLDGGAYLGALFGAAARGAARRPASA